MVDAEGAIVLVNREIERLFGYDREELIGQPVGMLVPLNMYDRHPDMLAAYFRNPQPLKLGVGRELHGRRKDGTEVPIEIDLTPVTTDEGLFVLSSIVDISARKAAEEERDHLQEMLRQSQKMEAIGTLAGGIAHDFNNLLAGIIGYTELVVRGLDDNPQAISDLQQVLKAATRGRTLVDRILRFSRRQASSRIPTDIAAVLRDTAGLLRATLPAEIRIEVNLATGAGRALADSTAVEQVLMNLATNAAHAMPGGGSLAIGLRSVYMNDSAVRANPALREGAYLVMTVQDTGAGMDEPTRQRVFEPFFTTKGPGEGSGLGLSMVHGIMRDHGGAVSVESEPGLGTVVRCYFPGLDQLDSEEVPISGALPTGQGERLLYVDDEPSLVRVGRRRLETLGYLVTTANGPDEALARFQNAPHPFAAVITDYSMPGTTGIELAERLRVEGNSAPVILLTGHQPGIPEQRLEGAGIVRTLKKPATLAEFAAVLREVLGRPVAHAGP